MESMNIKSTREKS